MKNKKGISLIVLVITIIVMIILAAAVIISMNNTGIIDKASHAVNLTDEKQVQDLASLLWAEAYLDEDRTDTMENVVKAGLAENKITDTDWDITVSDTGVTVSKKETSDVVLITFTINGTSYQAEEGMIWTKWVASSYNTINANISGTYIMIPDDFDSTWILRSSNGQEIISPTSSIIESYAYCT